MKRENTFLDTTENSDAVLIASFITISSNMPIASKRQAVILQDKDLRSTWQPGWEGHGIRHSRGIGASLEIRREAGVPDGPTTAANIADEERLRSLGAALCNESL